MLPAWVIYPDKQYRDRVDIEPEDVYRRMPDEVPNHFFAVIGRYSRCF
jgi:hypothetical protein